jgi:hypothetical protein
LAREALSLSLSASALYEMFVQIRGATHRMMQVLYGAYLNKLATRASRGWLRLAADLGHPFALHLQLAGVSVRANMPCGRAIERAVVCCGKVSSLK